MYNKKNKLQKSQFASGFRPADLDYFKPLEVSVDYGFEDAFRTFKSLVQKEKVVSLYKERQAYEKPSVKKRRKRRQAEERRLSMELKQKLINSGEWAKRMKKRQEKLDKKNERK